MKEEEPLNHEKMNQYTNELIADLAKLILSKPKSKEMSGAAVAALSHLLVMITVRLTGEQEAVEIISLAVSGAFKSLDQIRRQLGEI